MPLECSRIAASRAEGTPNGMSESAEIEAIVDKIVEGTEARGVKLAADIAIATPKKDVRAWSCQSFCARGHIDGKERTIEHYQVEPRTPPPGFIHADPGLLVDARAPSSLQKSSCDQEAIHAWSHSEESRRQRSEFVISS